MWLWPCIGQLHLTYYGNLRLYKEQMLNVLLKSAKICDKPQPDTQHMVHEEMIVVPKLRPGYGQAKLVGILAPNKI